MYRILTLLSFFICSGHQLNGQIFPREGSILNYRLIGFSAPPVSKTVNYKIEIAAGNYYTEDSFKKNIIQTLSSPKNKIIAEVPSFGISYTWRTEYTTDNSPNTFSEFHHFTTAIIPSVDTLITRFRITKNAEKYQDAYVFLDGTQVLYDMKGNPIWFLPPIDSGSAHIRDMKFTPRGTITYLEPGSIIEINYNGDILWKMPENKPAPGDTIQSYHHEFTRLSNGHYMTLGIKSVFSGLPSSGNGNKATWAGNDNPQSVTLGSIIEYDKSKNIVWSWNLSKYFKDETMFDPHENSFYFDEKNNNIYLSLRNQNSVIKIKYPQGNVLNTYGTPYKQDPSQTDNGLFCGQHSCKASPKGYLYLFNNNTCRKTLPTIVMLKEPLTEHGKPEKIWEYECTIDDTAEIATQKPYTFSSGGNVTELPDQSMLVSMGDPYSKVFILNRDKKILWSGIPEKYDPKKKKWELIALYRASIITSRNDLEQLIWNSEE